MTTNVKKIGEISIPVPWGQLAAKTWGEPDDPLILCFHGFLDNAGTFNRLIPYLPNSFYYVCIDLPGHGRSSYFPPNLPINTLNYILAYRYISLHFKRQFVILGHSYGAQLGYLYTQVYPKDVQKLIMLDTVTLFPVSVRNFKKYLCETIDNYLQQEIKMASGTRPTYTKEEALHKLHTGRSYAPIKLEGAEALLERSIEETEDGRYRFTLDPRIKNTFTLVRDLRYTKETIMHNPVRCPVLIILGTESTAQQVYFSSIIQYFKQRRNMRIKYAEGNHDVHNDYPERVAPFINKFLLYRPSKI
ncbi:serine hydrolase-like protein isoform X1 [Diabrotica virgifera virgifera]|uniref:Serine hydrolase-like protein isoform X1 n=1 Tax=Diabrotica virgifera virgifera TaxID=50390 RepID=A0A6P7GZM5_DIAVI|nr:serine hydrolase-like protein isoform X1 [Diabrotica virgifera virgifera]